jgi:recombination protein RecA
MARTKKETSAPSLTEDLSQVLADSINSKLGKGKQQLAYFLNGAGNDDPKSIMGWVSTGCSTLDLAISNIPNGGLPVGKIVEIMGMEQSGKSLLCAHIVKSTQEQGGVGVYIDTEASLDTRFLNAIGVDTKKMIYIPIDTLEDVWATVENAVVKFREKNPNKILTLIVDSQSAATTKSELETDFSRDGFTTEKSIINSKALRKITNLIYKQKVLLVVTNQLRDKVGAMAFAEKYTTSGGKALQFHSSVRLLAKNVSKIKEDVNGVEQIVGRETEVIVKKNRVGPPERKIRYEIYYDSGIDDNSGLFTMLKKYKILKGGGAGWYTYEMVYMETGEIIEQKFQGANGFHELVKRYPEVKQLMYEDICEKYIMKYQHEVKNFERDLDSVEKEEIDGE